MLMSIIGIHRLKENWQ